LFEHDLLENRYRIKCGAGFRIALRLVSPTDRPGVQDAIADGPQLRA
jgi:hypothetical protein